MGHCAVSRVLSDYNPTFHKYAKYDPISIAIYEVKLLSGRELVHTLLCLNGSWVQGSSQIHDASFSASRFISILRAFCFYSVLHLCSVSQLCSPFKICLFIAMPRSPCYQNSVLR